MTRRRWVYTHGGQPLPEPVEISEDLAPGHDGRMPLFTDRYLEGTCAPDGTDISSRRKRDEYMKREGLAHESDYRNHIREARERRAEFFRGNTGQHAEITETVGRAAYRLQTQRGKRR